MSLVRNIESNARKRSIIGAMKKLCDELGTLVVAEGVETPSESGHARRDRLRSDAGLPVRQATTRVSFGLLVTNGSEKVATRACPPGAPAPRAWRATARTWPTQPGNGSGLELSEILFLPACFDSYIAASAASTSARAVGASGESSATPKDAVIPATPPEAKRCSMR